MTEAIIETPRVLLRPFVDADLLPLIELCQDSDVMRYIAGGCQNEVTVAENLKKWRMEYEKRGYGLLAAIHKKEHCLIGFCGLIEQKLNNAQHTEIAYRLSKRYWGNGLATEMANAMRDHAFKVHGFNSLIAIIHQQNSASQKVATKIGMNFAKHDFYKGVAVDIYAVHNSYILNANRFSGLAPIDSSSLDLGKARLQ